MYVIDRFVRYNDAEDRCGEAKLLRPKHDDDDELLSSYLKPDDSREEMRLYEKGKMQEMYNDCIQQHSTEENMCAIPEFTICREVKVGLCWQCQWSMAGITQLLCMA